jgi:hypothetical protein
LRTLVLPSHFSDENPDKPESGGYNCHESIKTEVEKTITITHNILLLVPSHFTDKYPNQPNSKRQECHEDVPDEIEETVAFTVTTTVLVTITHDFSFLIQFEKL